jgi:hypothetical protein
MCRMSRLIRNNKDWDTALKNVPIVKINALAISFWLGGGTPGHGGSNFQRNPDKHLDHCFFCGNLDHHYRGCHALNCETCGKKVEGYQYRKAHYSNCPNRKDEVPKSKFQGDRDKRSRDKAETNKSGGYDSNKKPRYPSGAPVGGQERPLLP